MSKEKAMNNERVRVLAILDTAESLQLAALRLLEDDISPVGELQARCQKLMPVGFTLDSPPIVVPVGTGEILDDAEVERINPRQLLHPNSSKKFLVAGSLEVGDGGRVPDGFFADPPIGPRLTCGTSRAVGDAADVQTRLDTRALQFNGLDGNGVAIAVIDTGIYIPHLEQALGFIVNRDSANSWAPGSVATPAFWHRLGHGTMCAYDALLVAPQATLLDYAALLGRVDRSVQVTLVPMIVAYSKLLYLWKISSSPRINFPALVISNSWGIYHSSLDFPPDHPGRFIDNPCHPFRLLVWFLTRLARADVVFAAGNCGVDCPAPSCLRQTSRTIHGASAYPEVLTIGGCDVNYGITGYSSRGPAIAGMPDPYKPDVVAYAHFHGSEAGGRKRPDTGTSASCAIAAGAVAAIRTRLQPLSKPPAALNVVLRQTAQSFPSGSWNIDYGHGVLRPVAAARQLGLIP
ncbi:S8 family serine peptidase [Variovorax paradoxus]|nr:S8 family serine peptidase [Variovorax paradoxus]